MNIIISNRFSSIIKTLNIDVIKELNGQFEADEITKQLENIYYDHIIMDISALKNNTDISSIQKLSAAFDMSKVILLIDDTKYFSTQEFISSIISIGIYNFTKNIDGVKYLLEHPNSYKDVMKYHKVDAVAISKAEEEKNEKINQPRKYATIEEIYASTELTPAEKDELITKIRMQETIKKAKIGGEKSDYVRRKNTIFRIILTLVILPLMSILLTYGYFFLLYNFDNWFKPDGDIGKVLFKEILQGGPTYATILCITLLMLVIHIIYKIINAKIKSNKSSCLKFSLIPFGVFTAVFCIDKYFITFMDGLFKVENLTLKTYMTNSIYMDFQLVCYLMIIIYFIDLLFAKLRLLEFEQEISQKTTWIEIIFTIILTTTAFLPAIHELVDIFNYLTGVTEFFDNIFKIKNLMIYLSLLEIVGVIGLITIEIMNRFKINKAK